MNAFFENGRTSKFLRPLNERTNLLLVKRVSLFVFFFSIKSSRNVSLFGVWRNRIALHSPLRRGTQRASECLTSPTLRSIPATRGCTRAQAREDVSMRCDSLSADTCRDRDARAYVRGHLLARKWGEKLSCVLFSALPSGNAPLYAAAPRHPSC